MALSARVATPTEGATRTTVVVPVTFDAGEAFVAASVPAVIGGHSLPRRFSAAWCAQQGLKERPGGSTVVRSFAGLNVALVSLGPTLNDPDAYRLAGASAARAGGGGDVAVLLPTDGLDDPAALAQALVEGALLSSYRFKAGPDASFDVVPLGDPLPSVAVHDAVSEGVRRGTVVGTRRQLGQAARRLAGRRHDAQAPGQGGARAPRGRPLRRRRGLVVVAHRRGAPRRAARGRPGLAPAAAPGLRDLRPGARRGAGPRGAGRQGRHLRLRRPLAQDQRGHDGHEDRHDRRRRGAGRALDRQPPGPARAGDGDRADGREPPGRVRDQARRRADRAQRRLDRGAQHRRRGPAPAGRRAEPRGRGRPRRDRRRRDADRRAEGRPGRRDRRVLRDHRRARRLRRGRRGARRASRCGGCRSTRPTTPRSSPRSPT